MPYARYGFGLIAFCVLSLFLVVFSEAGPQSNNQPVLDVMQVVLPMSDTAWQMEAARFQNAAPTPRCPSESALCIAQQRWSTSDIEARLGEDNYAVWQNGDFFNFAYRGAADRVMTCCGIQEVMQRVSGTDLWALSVRVQALSQAIISYGFRIASGDDVIWTDIHIWRGPDAPAAPETVPELAGRVIQPNFMSPALGETRRLTIYLPPNYDNERSYPVVYAADGDAVRALAAYVEPHIVAGRLPELLLIGTQSGSFSNERDQRAEEYIPDLNSQQFAMHETFFTLEVRLWAEEILTASRQRDERFVFGFSNGGVFAASMALRHPELYAHALPFSPGVSPFSDGAVIDPSVSYYLVAGVLERNFYNNTLHLEQQLRANDVPTQFHSRVSGHNFVLWQELFAEALIWSFAQ